MQVFGTPAMGGFNRRGAHPDGGHYYGGAETALIAIPNKYEAKIIYKSIYLYSVECKYSSTQL